MVIYTITYPPAPYPSLVQPDYGSIEPGSPRYPGLIPYPSFVQQAPGLFLHALHQRGRGRGPTRWKICLPPAGGFFRLFRSTSMGFLNGGQ